MTIASRGMWTPHLIMESVAFAAVLILILFGITLICVAGYYFIRVAGSSLFGKPFTALQKRTAAAVQSANLSLMTVVCGPLIGLFICLISLPVMLISGLKFIEFVKQIPILTGAGALAGIIGGGAFWVSSALLGRVRKTVKKWARGGVWDPDLDGVA
jgi:hypothetical protein